MSSNERLKLDISEEDKPLHPLDEALRQGAESDEAIARNPSDFLHLPWPALDAVVGGIGRGEVWMVGAYSGQGKTIFLMSLLNFLFDLGKRVFYMGLESVPWVLRTQWACIRLGLSAGDVLSGKLASESAEWSFIRAKLKHEIERQALDDASARVYFSPQKFVDAFKLRDAIEQAADLGSDVLIIDHVDHLEGSAGGLYENSVQIHKVLLDAAQKYGVRVLAATQFNNEMIKGNRLGMHMPPSPTAVYMGNHKRQVASGMLGLYKPLKFDITKDEMQKFARGELEPIDVVERGVMACLVMKHRLFGEREGRRVLLKVERGIVTDLPERDGPPPFMSRI
jgi:KaiC/GvpD/RAD55 family RecA-like ATPase